MGIVVGGGRREDGLDKLLKVLSLANQGVGVVSGIQNFRTSMTEKDLKDEQYKQLKNKGKGPSLKDLMDSGDEIVDPQPPSLAQGPLGSQPPSLTDGPQYGALSAPVVQKSYIDNEGNSVPVSTRNKEQTKVLGDVVRAYQKDFRSDVQKNIQTIESLRNATDALDTGKPIGQEIARRMIARVAQGSGVLSDKDVAAFAGGQAVDQRLERWVQLMTDGTMRGQDAAEFRRLISIVGENTKNQIAQVGKGYATQLSRTTGLSPEEAEYRIAADAFPQLNSSMKKETKPGDKSKPKETEEQKKARLIKELQGG